MAPDKNVVQDHVVTINGAPGTNPGFVNYMGTEAKDFDLVAGSPAIDKGTLLADITLDFVNRTVPDAVTGIPDVGAYEYQSTQVSTPPTFPGTIPPPAYFGGLDSGGNTGTLGTGGAGGMGGTTATGKGGAGGGSTTRVGTGGVSGSGGTPTATATPPGSGGAPGSGGVPTSTTTTGGNGKGGCSCHLGQAQGGLGLWAGLLGFALLALRRRTTGRR